MRKPGVPSFSFSAAESAVLILLLICLLGAITVKVIQRTRPAGGVISVSTAASDVRHRVELNTASREELALVPGIAAARAQKIVEYRRKQGGFGAIDELVNIEGFSERLVEQLREYLYIRPTSQRHPE